MSSQWVVYILQCSDMSLYTGITTDLDRRVKEHNRGVGAKYTKGRTPVRVMYTECCDNRSDATKREMSIKGLSRSNKIKLMEGKP